MKNNAKNYIWRCDLSRQYAAYKDEIDAVISRVLRSGVYTLGKEVELFEKEFAAYTGRKYGTAVASGTDALVLAMKAAGIRRGDKIITSTYAPTPVATAILLAGGIPIFTDVEKRSCLMSIEEMEQKARIKSVRFIVPVHIFGYVCDMYMVRKVAGKRGLIVIEDCAQAHGSKLKDKMAGTFGDVSCFSFYPTKNLGAYGDGGMVLTDNRAISERVKLLRNYGKRHNPFESEVLGYNSRLDEVQAAILRTKLRYLDEMNKKRAALVEIYRKGLKKLPVVFLEKIKESDPNYHILTVLCERRRDDLIGYLETHGIQTNIYYPKPLHLMKAFNGYVPSGDRFPVSAELSKKAVALPLYPELEETKVCYIIDRIKEFYKRRDKF